MPEGVGYSNFSKASRGRIHRSVGRRLLGARRSRSRMERNNRSFFKRLTGRQFRKR